MKLVGLFFFFWNIVVINLWWTHNFILTDIMIGKQTSIMWLRLIGCTTFGLHKLLWSGDHSDLLFDDWVTIDVKITYRLFVVIVLLGYIVVYSLNHAFGFSFGVYCIVWLFVLSDKFLEKVGPMTILGFIQPISVTAIAERAIIVCFFFLLNLS